MSAPTALVLGGSGLLGQALVNALNEADWRVDAPARSEGDILHPDFLEARFKKTAPDVVFNCIAYTAVDAAEDNKDAAFALNRSFPLQLGRMVRGTGARLFHYSTDFVFNGKLRVPYTEEDQTDPLNVYGASKLAGEQALLELEQENICIVRTAWLFGPGRKNFVSTILDLARTRDSISVVHDQVGSPTYTPDLALASLALAGKNASGLVHAVNSGQASWCELACEAVALANYSAQVSAITSKEWPLKAVRPRYSVLSTQRLSALTGCAPRPWPHALRDFVFGSTATEE